MSLSLVLRCPRDWLFLRAVNTGMRGPCVLCHPEGMESRRMPLLRFLQWVLGRKFGVAPVRSIVSPIPSILVSCPVLALRQVLGEITLNTDQQMCQNRRWPCIKRLSKTTHDVLKWPKNRSIATIESHKRGFKWIKMGQVG